MLDQKLIGAILIISGTAVGVGLLALPISTAAYGFFPTLAILILAFGFMTLTSFLLLEANLWLPENTNLISMAKATLGKQGELFAWFNYLFLVYALLTAYITGLSNLLQLVLQESIHISIPNWGTGLFFTISVSCFLLSGIRSLDYLNRFLMIGLVISYFILSFKIVSHLNPSLLMESTNLNLLPAFPIVAVSFGYQVVIPSLRSYLNGNVRQLSLSIIIGGFIAFLFYAFWIFAIMGSIPFAGETGLDHIQKLQGDNAANLAIALSQNISTSWVNIGFKYFTFFAIITSFLWVALALYDFLKDGLKIKNIKKERLIITIFTMAPPFIISQLFPEFIKILSYGGVLVSTLFILAPALMVWQGRKKFKGSFKTPGGIASILISIIGAFLFVLPIFL